MYNTLIAPYFDYCSSVWGCIGKCQSKRLQKLENRAARIITNSSYATPSSSLLCDLGWDTLEQRHVKQLVVTLYNVINGLLPARLRNIFKNSSEIHSHSLRSSVHNLFIPRPLSEAGKCSFHYRGATLWNSLPTQTKNQATLISFKESLPAN